MERGNIDLQGTSVFSPVGKKLFPSRKLLLSLGKSQFFLLFFEKVGTLVTFSAKRC